MSITPVALTRSWRPLQGAPARGHPGSKAERSPPSLQDIGTAEVFRDWAGATPDEGAELRRLGAVRVAVGPAALRREAAL